MEAAKLSRLVYFSQICRFPCLSAVGSHNTMWWLSPRGQEAINRSVNRRLLIMLGHLQSFFGKIADLQMTTLPRAMKSSALLTKGGNIDQYLSALASWYVNILHQWKLLASQYSKNIQRFWHKIAAEVWDWCCGMILVLIETGQVSTLGSAESPSKSSSHLSQSSKTSSDRVPEFHSWLRQSPRVPQPAQER